MGPEYRHKILCVAWGGKNIETRHEGVLNTKMQISPVSEPASDIVT
jgi:hypothetical protein